MSDTNAVTTETPSKEEAVLMPPVDVIEDSTGITLYADLPGVSKDKLNMHIEGDTLTIEAELSLDTPANMQASRAEVKIPRYRRSFALSKELDAENIKAEFKLGVLKLHIPKGEQAQPRKIAINVE